MKCPFCKDEFYTKIQNEKNTIYEGNYLCLNCMSIFDKKENIIKRG